MRLCIFADGQTVYEPLLEILLVILQHRLQRIVQKLYVLFQFGKVISADGGILLLVHTETILGQSKTIVLAEVFCVCEGSRRSLIDARGEFHIPFHSFYGSVHACRPQRDWR